MKCSLTCISALCLITFSVSLFAQDKPSGKVHGYVFGDYYYMLGADTAAVRGVGQYSGTRKDYQAFQFRRLYFYYDYTFSERFAAQFLLEANDKALEPGGKHGVFVKTAYLEWKDILPMSALSFGLVPTPTWSLLSEKVWNYRSIEKTIIDFRGLGNASDIGVLLRGKFNEKGTFAYNAMIGNGNGQKPESNKYKKYYLGLNAKPAADVIVEGYVDYEPAANDRSKMTLKGFAAYQTSDLTVGIEVFRQEQKKAGASGTDQVPFGVAGFLWAPIPGVKGLNGFARYDYYNPDTEVSDRGFNENFVAVGLDYMPISNVHIMPNVWLNSFSAKGAGERDADIVARITFFYVYK